MKTAETLALIQAHGLSPELGYKIKDASNTDLAWFHVTESGAWSDLLNPPQAPWTAQEVTRALQLAAVTGHHVTVFDCCCLECYTPERRDWTKGYMLATGIQISHGYWPRCFQQLLEAI